MSDLIPCHFSVPPSFQGLFFAPSDPGRRAGNSRSPPPRLTGGVSLRRSERDGRRRYLDPPERGPSLGNGERGQKQSGGRRPARHPAAGGLRALLLKDTRRKGALNLCGCAGGGGGILKSGDTRWQHEATNRGAHAAAWLLGRQGHPVLATDCGHRAPPPTLSWSRPGAGGEKRPREPNANSLGLFSERPLDSFSSFQRVQKRGSLERCMRNLD